MSYPACFARPVIGIVRNPRSTSIGITDRHQSESAIGITGLGDRHHSESLIGFTGMRNPDEEYRAFVPRDVLPKGVERLFLVSQELCSNH